MAARNVAAVLMLGLWLGTLALAIVPELHHCVHHEAQSPQHECVFTQVSKGELLFGVVPSAPALPARPAFELPSLNEHGASSPADVRLAPSRAPPRNPASHPAAG